MMPRHNTVQLENTTLLGARNGMDSFTTFIFPNKNQHMEGSSKNLPPQAAKKNHSQKVEELETCLVAIKTHLNVAVDEVERLKRENNELRMQSQTNNLQQKIDFGLLSTNYEAKEDENDGEESENELEATL